MPFNPAPLGTDLTLFSPTTGLPKKQQVDPKILALREQYSNPTYKMTEEEALEYACKHVDTFMKLIEEKGWETDHLLIPVSS